MRDAVRQFVRAAAAGGAGAGDSDLLRRFVDAADEDAFAELVRRHGPMVLDVCRCVLGNHADAEDAFQATFLVLAKRAGTIRKAGSLAAWLHGIAYRTARRAQARAATRREHEAKAPAREASSPDDLSWAEVRLAIHEALAALGEIYREPLVLCYLGGRTQDQAAKALGLSEAALKKRLERGREKLRDALVRRGLGPTALLAALAAPAVVSAVPHALAEVAARLATTPAASVPPAILTLTHAEVTPMVLSPLKAALCLLPVLVVGAVLGGTPPQRETQAQAPAAPPVALRAEEKAEPPPGKPEKPAPKQETPAEQDAKRLAGEWKVHFVEAGGKTAFPDDDLRDARITFKDGKAEVKGFELLFVRNFTFKLDPTASPKEIDVTFLEGDRKGDTFAGAYVILKNEVRIVLRLEHTKFGRPKGFSTVSGAGLYTFFLRPADEKNPPPKPADAPKAPAPGAPTKTCRVTGTITTSEYAKAGGSLERGIVYAYTALDRKQVAYSNEKGGNFAIDLAPGDYVLQCTGVGSRGAIFEPTDKKITVTASDTKLNVGEIDMPSGKVTKLFGKAAPELDGAVAWKNTPPLTMKGLKGKVVVLDFWSYSCSICLQHKPDLAKLQEKYQDKPLAVLTVHDASAATMEDVEAKVPEPIKKKAGHLAVALDRKGEKGIFASYGATAVPMVVVIDQEGTVVRRFHHAGDPELEKEVERLLAKQK